MKAIFAGSFDPPTLGHLDVIKRAAPLFEKLYVVIATNTTKQSLLKAEGRLKIFENILSGSQFSEKCEVLAFPGLVADLCSKYKIQYLVRGIRSSSDLEREIPMSIANELLSSGVTTILVPSTKENAYVSSTLVREIFSLGGDISHFVPREVLEYLEKKAKGNKK